MKCKNTKLLNCVVVHLKLFGIRARIAVAPPVEIALVKSGGAARMLHPNVSARLVPIIHIVSKNIIYRLDY